MKFGKKGIILVGAVVGLVLVLLSEMRRTKIAGPTKERGVGDNRRTALEPKAGPTVKTEGTAAAATPGAWSPATDIVIEGEVFTDPNSKIKGRIPVGWMLRTATRRGPDELSISFVSPARPKVVLTHYYAKSDRAGETAEALLEKAVLNKTKQRVGDGFAEYRVLPERVPAQIGGAPALSWRAEFVRDNVKWIERVTRVQAPAFVVQAFMMGPNREFSASESSFDAFVAGYVLPR